MKLLIPAISPERAWNCLSSLRIDPKDIIVVDNTVHGMALPYQVGCRVHVGRNLGVSRSWNIGVRMLMESDDEALVICSQSMSFGAAGGRDLMETLGDEWGAEYASFGWHLNSFSRQFFEVFGFFDENFYPAYFEDTDALYRMGLLGIPSPRENGQSRPHYTIDATCAEAGSALTEGAAKVDFYQLGLYYEAKWGGQQGFERFTRPFNVARADVNWWPNAHLAGQVLAL